MLVKGLPIRGTVFHVHDRKKYYPGGVYEVDDATGAELVKRKIAEKIDPPKRGPGRPPKIKRSRHV